MRFCVYGSYTPMFRLACAFANRMQQKQLLLFFRADSQWLVFRTEHSRQVGYSFYRGSSSVSLVRDATKLFNKEPQRGQVAY